eukprot:6849-Rhodomonas_salina.4
MPPAYAMSGTDLGHDAIGWSVSGSLWVRVRVGACVRAWRVGAGMVKVPSYLPSYALFSIILCTLSTILRASQETSSSGTELGYASTEPWDMLVLSTGICWGYAGTNHSTMLVLNWDMRSDENEFDFVLSAEEEEGPEDPKEWVSLQIVGGRVTGVTAWRRPGVGQGEGVIECDVGLGDVSTHTVLHYAFAMRYPVLAYQSRLNTRRVCYALSGDGITGWY